MSKLSVSNILDPDQDRFFIGPDLGPNCLQRIYQQTIKVAASKERENKSSLFYSCQKMS